MVISKHVAFGMPYMATIPTTACSFNEIAVVALTVWRYNAVLTFVNVINGTGVGYLKVVASAFRASLVCLPIFFTHNQAIYVYLTLDFTSISSSMTPLLPLFQIIA